MPQNDEAVVFFGFVCTLLHRARCRHSQRLKLLTILFGQICRVIKLNFVINLNFLQTQSSPKCFYIALIVYI